jgi:hypothetical protein
MNYQPLVRDRVKHKLYTVWSARLWITTCMLVDKIITRGWLYTVRGYTPSYPQNIITYTQAYAPENNPFNLGYTRLMHVPTEDIKYYNYLYIFNLLFFIISNI